MPERFKLNPLAQVLVGPSAEVADQNLKEVLEQSDLFLQEAMARERDMKSVMEEAFTRKRNAERDMAGLLQGIMPADLLCEGRLDDAMVIARLEMLALRMRSCATYALACSVIAATMVEHSMLAYWEHGQDGAPN